MLAILPTEAVINNLIDRIEFSYGHFRLIETIRQVFPNFCYIAKRGGWHREGGLVTPDGERVAISFKSWAQKKYKELGNVRDVWKFGHDAGLVGTIHEGTTFYFSWPFGPEPADFLQLSVDYTQEVACEDYFYEFCEWIDIDDLTMPSACLLSDPFTVAKGQYQVDKLLNVSQYMKEAEKLELENRNSQRSILKKKTVNVQILQPGDDVPPTQQIPFLEMFPDYLERSTHAQRILMDWKSSSPGKEGIPFCLHWMIRPFNYSDSSGCHMGFTPQWADGDGGLDLPEIHSQNFSSVYSLMGALEDFDSQTGYPFSWYFYGLHGNRITQVAVRRITEAIKRGKIRLPECDEKVLLAWSESEYGF